MLSAVNRFIVLRGVSFRGSAQWLRWFETQSCNFWRKTGRVVGANGTTIATFKDSCVAVEDSDLFIYDASGDEIVHTDEKTMSWCDPSHVI